MRVVAATVGAAIAAMAPAFAADLPVKARPAEPVVASPWEIILNQELRYYSWSGNRGFPTNAVAASGSGSQFYAPIGLQLNGKPFEELKLELLGRSGYVWSRQSVGGFTGEVSTVTDTVLSGTATYLGWNGFQPFVSLNVNAPTGRSALFGFSALARMDSDLVEIATFGEGWNLGPTVGVNIPLTENLMLSLGVGYTYRGPYDRETAPAPITGAQGVDRLDPGDNTTVNASLAYQVGALSLQGTASYAFETDTRLNGVLFFRTGDRYLLSGTAGYAWSDAWKSSLTASFSHFDRNEVAIFGLPGLVVEAFNSNSNVVRVALDTTYTVGAFALGPTLSYLNRDHNAYSPTANQFVSAKTRWAAGGMLQYTVNPKAVLTVKAEHVWIDEEENPAKLLGMVPIPGTAVPQVLSTGWMASVGGVFTF
jgi:hypothetical protein